MRSGGLAIDRLKRISIGSPNLLLEAVRGGIGATLFTMTLAQEEIAAGRVVRIELPRPIVVDYIAVLPKAPLHPLAEPFAEWVKTLL
jgi:LysR family glycine cleavage system transcriptional activator